jgi:hypothetical protein
LIIQKIQNFQKNPKFAKKRGRFWNFWHFWKNLIFWQILAFLDFFLAFLEILGFFRKYE